MPFPVITTARLTLRPVTEEDLSLMVELNSDAAVMAHILGRPASADETAAEWSERLSRRTDAARGRATGPATTVTNSSAGGEQVRSSTTSI